MSEVRKIDPDFLKNVEDPILLSKHPSTFESRNGARFSGFVREFDDSLGGLTPSLLITK